MAKPKVVKVKSQFHLKDLYYAEKLKSGDKVCLSLPLRFKAKQTKRKYKFARGVLTMKFYRTCECCGPWFYATLEKADGTKLILADDLSRFDGKGVLPF